MNSYTCILFQNMHCVCPFARAKAWILWRNSIHNYPQVLPSTLSTQHLLFCRPWPNCSCTEDWPTSSHCRSRKICHYPGATGVPETSISSKLYKPLSLAYTEVSIWNYAEISVFHSFISLLYLCLSCEIISVKTYSQ